MVGETDNTVKDATGLDLGVEEKTKPITDVRDDTLKGLGGGTGLGLGNVKLP